MQTERNVSARGCKVGLFQCGLSLQVHFYPITDFTRLSDKLDDILLLFQAIFFMKLSHDAQLHVTVTSKYYLLLVRGGGLSLFM